MFGTNIPNHPLSTGLGFSDGDELNRINPQAVHLANRIIDAVVRLL